MAPRSLRPSRLEGSEPPTGTLIPEVVAAVLVLAVSAYAHESPGTVADQTTSSAAADVRPETGGRIRFFTACSDNRDSGECWEGCLDLLVMAPDGTATEKLAELTAWTTLRTAPEWRSIALTATETGSYSWQMSRARIQRESHQPVAPSTRLGLPTEPGSHSATISATVGELNRWIRQIGHGGRPSTTAMHADSDIQ